LNLEIFTPTLDRFERARMDTFPVMIWFHGGGFNMGSSQLFGVQDPSYFAEHKNVVIVAMHYRLGALGFAVTKALGGNYGLLDQRLAMHWVRDNIHRCVCVQLVSWNHDLQVWRRSRPSDFVGRVSRSHVHHVPFDESRKPWPIPSRDHAGELDLKIHETGPTWDRVPHWASTIERHRKPRSLERNSLVVSEE
jgi:hypothetical protein